MNKEFLARITYNPAVMVGKPVIRGTRIPVDLIVRLVAQGIPQAEILADYPRPQYIAAQILTAINRYSYWNEWSRLFV